MSGSAGMSALTWAGTMAPAFNPATLAWEGWWRANYGGSPWTGTTSAGGSGGAPGRSISEATNPPSTGTAQNGYTPADFDGTNDVLDGTGTMATFFSGAAGTFAVLCLADSAAAAASIPYDDECLFSDAGVGAVCMSFTTSGVKAYIYDGADKSVTVAQGTGSYFLAIMRWDNTNLKLRVNSGSDSSTGAGTMSNTTGTFRLGANYNASQFFDGRILEAWTAASAISDADCTNLKSYVNARYALSL